MIIIIVIFCCLYSWKVVASLRNLILFQEVNDQQPKHLEKSVNCGISLFFCCHSTKKILNIFFCFTNEGKFIFESFNKPPKISQQRSFWRWILWFETNFLWSFYETLEKDLEIQLEFERLSWGISILEEIISLIKLYLR